MVDLALYSSHFSPNDRRGVASVICKRASQNLELLSSALRLGTSLTRLACIVGLDIGNDDPRPGKMKVNRFPGVYGLDPPISIAICEGLIADARNGPVIFVCYCAAVAAPKIRLGETSTFSKKTPEPSIIGTNTTLDQSGNICVTLRKGPIETHTVSIGDPRPRITCGLSLRSPKQAAKYVEGCDLCISWANENGAGRYKQSTTNYPPDHVPP
ncbi:hypothetical protein [Methylobacterium komagatae]